MFWAMLTGVLAVAALCGESAADPLPSELLGSSPPDGTNAPVAVVDLTNALALADAFRITLAANQDIRIASMETERADALADSAGGAFEPVFFAAAARGARREPVASVPITRTDSESSFLTVGARTRLATGTEAELSSVLDYTEDDASSNALDPEHTGRASLTIRQDLLRDFVRGFLPPSRR